MTDRLWSGWRSAYVSGETAADTGPDDDATTTDRGSVFTRILRSGLPDEQTHVVHRGATVFAVANLYPYTSGHLLVVPYREVADLADLSPAEHTDLWGTVTRAVEVVRTAYRPDGVNVGCNLGRASGGSVPSHLHVHVVPRWIGDANFMAAIADTQTVPEAIGITAHRLREAWAASPATPGPDTAQDGGGADDRS